MPSSGVTGPRVRWRHRRTRQVGPTDIGWQLSLEPPGTSADAARTAATREDLTTAISSAAEVAFAAYEEAAREAEQIRRDADDYAESKWAEAARMLEEAPRRALEAIRNPRGDADHGALS